MKTGRPALRTGRKEQRYNEPHNDSYRSAGKLAEPSRCPRCGAAYNKGRWTWGAAATDAAIETCPACRRIEDNFPGGYVTLKGRFFDAHRDEILNVVSAREARARSEHPMQRIIGVETLSSGVRVTTTDAHLARGIAVAIHEAFKGDLDVRFSKDENLVRAVWSR